MTFCYTQISLCLGQPPSEKLPPVAEGNTYRDPWPGITQRVRDLGTLILKWHISIKYLPSKLREPLQKRKQKECKSQRAWRTPRKQGPVNQHD